MIYFVRCSLTDLVKIGYSAKPHHRMVKMQSDSPGTLTLLGLEAGAIEREAELHGQFARCRVRGEWFMPDHDLAHYLSQLVLPTKPSDRKRLGGPIGAWIAEQGITLTEFARLASTSKATVSLLCSGKAMPTWPMMRRIAQVTSGKVMPSDFIPTDFLAAAPCSCDERTTAGTQGVRSPFSTALET